MILNNSDELMVKGAKMKRNPYLLCLLSLLSVFLISNTTQAQIVQGRVFNDQNRNGVFDAGEQGLPGILVSNQEDVVTTDQGGQYHLSISDNTVIFVTKPAGYQFPLDDLNTILFYHIHQPEGSPPFQYPGIKPTGDLPESINFPLYRIDEPDTFEVIVFADPQPRSKTEIAYIRDDVVAELIGSPAQFGLVLGDIMYDDLSICPDYQEVIAQLGIPFYHAPGNHDMNYDSPDDAFALETFKNHFGPPYYSFDYGQVHFIILDDVQWLKRGQEKAHYQGMLGEKQLKWLANDLRNVPEDKLIVFAMHIPLYTFLSEHKSVNVLDRAEMFHLIKNRQHLLVLAGHMHLVEHQYLVQTQDWQGAEPLHQITCATVSGSWWSGPKDERGIPGADQRDGVPNGYHIFTFRGTEYVERFKAAGKDPDHQMRISFPKGVISQNDLSDSLIIVNVFNGSARSTVEYRIDDSKYQPLVQKIRTDPYFWDLYREHRETYADWIKPRRSNHIWTANLPDDLTPGVHKIEIRTIDQYGRLYKSAGIFKVVDSS